MEGSSMDEFMKELCSKLNEVMKQTSNDKKQLPEEELLTRNETADFLKITLPTLSRWSDLGYLKPYYMGSRVYYDKSEILSYLKKKGGQND